MKRMGELAGTADWQKKRGGEKPPRFPRGEMQNLVRFHDESGYLTAVLWKKREKTGNGGREQEIGAHGSPLCLAPLQSSRA